MLSAVKKAPSCGVNMKSGGTVRVSVHLFSLNPYRGIEEDILINK